jgi:anti-sigma regulatory factor (Ser/Thr protein kinase)
LTENAIEWGNRRQKELTVRVAYELTDEFVKIVITDQGSGFNPRQLPHAARDDDPTAHLTIREKLGLRDGGFGILLSRGMVDDVRYNEAGNQVTLIKRFQRGQSAEVRGQDGLNLAALSPAEPSQTEPRPNL